jgi:hypothetical protein
MRQPEGKIDRDTVARSIIADSQSMTQNLADTLREKAGLPAHQNSTAILEALDKADQARSALRHWENLLEQTQDERSRSYYEGLMQISVLKAVHQELVSDSHERLSREKLHDQVIRDYEGKAQTLAQEVANRIQPSGELARGEKQMGKAVDQLQVHQSRVEAFELLKERYQELRQPRTAEAYRDQGRLEGIKASDMENVVQAYQTKVAELRIAEPAKPDAMPSLRAARESLERAETQLENYHKSYLDFRESTRQTVEFQKTIQSLELESAKRTLTPTEQKVWKEALQHHEKFTQTAEREAFTAMASYRSYQNDLKAAEHAYGALSHALKGKGLDLTSVASRQPPVAEPEKSQPATPSLKEPELRKPGFEVSRSGYGSRGLGVGFAVAAATRETLREMDREL